MPHASLNGIDVYYERFGEGPTLLFVNGSGASIATSRASLENYAQHFEVVVHDQRGLGATEVPSPPYTMSDYASDAVALLDHLDLDRVRVIGASFGGMVAQELAVTHPSGSSAWPCCARRRAGRAARRTPSTSSWCYLRRSAGRRG